MSDLIERQAAIDALRVAYWDDKIQSAKDDPCIVDAMTDWAIRQVEALPSAQPERKKGWWILVKGSNGKDYHKCSECLHTQDITGVKNYCAVCGAEMEGET